MQEILIQTTEMEFQTREAYKTLRSNIEFSGDHTQTIVITSCIPNEGKSEVSFELAQSIAENGDRVLLIDADLRKSVMYNHFKGGRIQVGLTHYLTGKATLEEVLCQTNKEGFYVIFSGPRTPIPSELLSSDQFKKLLEETKEQFDFIIIDTPPLGSVIDGAIVGAQCDGTILVMSSGMISYRFAQNVQSQLKQADCRVLGCVLNKVEFGNRKGYYGKYYGKYYGNYYGSYGE